MVRATPAPAPAPDAREAVARAICTACDEIPDHAGDCQGNDWRWQDYLGAADAAIAAATHAPAAATGKPGLHVAQAQAVPAGAEPVSLAAAVLLGVEYAREALATHDQQFANHPATALERESIVADIATMEASLASPVAEDRQETIIGHSVERGGWCVYSHYHGGDYTFEMGPFATRGGAEAAVRAPQAPQQAECPECIEQARLLGAGSEREAALTAEIEQLRLANEQYGQRERWWNDKMFDLEQQVASHSAGIARLQQICTSIHDGLLRGEDDRDLIALAAQAWDGKQVPQQAELTDEQLAAAWSKLFARTKFVGGYRAFARAVIAADRALRASGMGALAEDAKRDIDSIIGATAMLGHPAGTGAEAEARPLAADAARYRWLRSGRMFRQGQPTSAHSRRISKDALSALMAFSFWCEPEELDGLIDAEISKAQVTGMQGDVP